MIRILKSLPEIVSGIWAHEDSIEVMVEVRPLRSTQRRIDHDVGIATRTISIGSPIQVQWLLLKPTEFRNHHHITRRAHHCAKTANNKNDCNDLANLFLPRTPAGKAIFQCGAELRFEDKDNILEGFFNAQQPK